MNRFIYRYKDIIIPLEKIVQIDLKTYAIVIDGDSINNKYLYFETIEEAEKELNRLADRLTEYYRMKLGVKI